MRKICVVTGSRADYGLLMQIMKEIRNDPGLELQTIATGMHLSPEFGLTYKVIEEDGFTIDAKVEMLLSSDTVTGVTKSIGLGVIGFADALHRLQPDIMVVLGDRYEILAATQAALVSRIPVAHIHGGETTEGAIDESIRHAVTKMSHLHFVAAESYRRRVIQMGEQPESVVTVGAPGLDGIRFLQLLDREQLECSIGFKLESPRFLVTYHPATLGTVPPEVAMVELLRALDRFPEASIIFTRPNSDTAGRIINKLIDNYLHANPERTIAFTSMGQLLYLSAMKLVDMVIGNSSSGIIEAPFLKTPTVNIGARQDGRLKATSICDCGEAADEIERAISKVLSKDFCNKLPSTVSLYGAGETSKIVTQHLKAVSLQGIEKKRFYDL